MAWTIEGGTSAVLATALTSSFVDIPAGWEYIGMMTMCPGLHWRIGLGSPVAVPTDPLLTSAAGLVIIANPYHNYPSKLAVIADGLTLGTFSAFRMMV